jgi:PAS domain S-box-containing protein
MAFATGGVLSLTNHLDNERIAQTTLARISHLVDSVRFKPTFYFAAGRMPQADVDQYRSLADELSRDARSLAQATPLGAPILAAVTQLERVMNKEVALLQRGDVVQAKHIDERAAAAAYVRLGSDATSSGAANGGLLVPADQQLADHVADVHGHITLALVIDVLGAGLLVIVVITGGAFLRRRRALRDADQAARTAAAEYLTALMTESSDLVVVTDDHGVITYVSPSVQHILGLSDTSLIGSPARDLWHPDDKPQTARHLAQFVARTSPGAIANVRARHKDGTYRITEITMTNLLDDPVVGGIVLNARDITERIELESQLMHSQKLESVGQLASGIAHEINTPIQFIGDNVRFLGDAFAGLLNPSDSNDAADADYLEAEVPLAIEQTLEGIDRVATIVRAMKAFGHPGTDEKAPTDLNEAVRNTLIVASNTVKHVADVTTDLGELPRVWCHPGDINQVLVNLVVNAAHAIADNGTQARGLITVHSYVDGSDAVIQITDTGCGIEPDVATRVFEPFFTTKEVGRGTGQGLSLAYALVTKRHGGTIRFASTPGAGTTFTVRLPIAVPPTVARVVPSDQEAATCPA